MIYVISLITGILNGVFASGAGQILVVYLVFIKKIDTHEARALSVSLLSISSIFAIFGYMNFVDFEWKYIIVFGIISAITGVIGTKLMKKIPADILNLVSGGLIVSLTLYKMIGGK
ncbi:MAG: sulfite exporter TauE/SafE family protein [Clostridia bacterium]|nr:sulfite exporter TauE/SafE family protein [Clostridia bacterium]